MSASGKWDDLAPRILSAIVLSIIATSALLFGSLTFGVFIALCCGVMIWEVSTISQTSKEQALIFAVLAFGAVVYPSILFVQLVLFVIIAVLIATFARLQKALAGATAIAVLLGGLGLSLVETTGGVKFIIGLVGIVILTDIAGYLVGRLVGGPKFWPAISPKKTWSGILGGWGASAVFNVVLNPFEMSQGTTSLVIIAIIISFISQMGDIGESLLKRRVGVKDSSTLIPGHGGFLDRFDGVTAAGVVGLILTLGT